MREMRDSGVEWIGEIPKDWNCCKQKYRFTLINRHLGATAFRLSKTVP